ncbi:MAG: putative OB-fold protein [Alphaproteobacteria bacterium]|jgi:uncharacterized protein
MSETRIIASPQPNPETEKFWEAASSGKLMIGSCKSCSKVHWYPRAICPHCFSDQTELKEAAGTGEVYTFSVMKRAKIPFAIAYVTLAEGPKMMTNIVDTDLDAITIGQKVKVVFKETEDGPPVPMFTPA